MGYASEVMLHMLIIEEVLEEEYWRSMDITDAMEQQLEHLPLATISIRQDEEKVSPHHVMKSEIEELRACTARRIRLERILRDQAETRAIIVRGLGRTPVDRP